MALRASGPRREFTAEEYLAAGFREEPFALVDMVYPEPEQAFCVDCEDPAVKVHAKGRCRSCYYRAKRTASR